MAEVVESLNCREGHHMSCPRCPCRCHSESVGSAACESGRHYGCDGCRGCTCHPRGGHRIPPGDNPTNGLERLPA